MIQAQTISVTLKTEIQQRIDDTVIAILHLKTNTPQRTIKKWLQEASSKLTHYSFLIALSEIFSTPIENLIDIHRQYGRMAIRPKLYIPNTYEHVKP